jgi:hypothetical protein
LGELREGEHLEHPRLYTRIILKRIFKKWDGGMDWINLAQDRVRWQALVNAVMHLRVPQIAGNFMTGKGPFIFFRRTLLNGVI